MNLIDGLVLLFLFLWGILQRALPGRKKEAESVPDAVETADPAGDKGIFLKTYGNVLVLEELLC